MTYTTKQAQAANDILRGYKGAEFSADVFQGSQWIFKAKMDFGTYFVIVGARGSVIDCGWA